MGGAIGIGLALALAAGQGAPPPPPAVAAPAAPAPAAPALSGALSRSQLTPDGRVVVVLRGQRAVVRLQADGALALLSVSDIDAAALTAPAVADGARATPELTAALSPHVEPGALALSLGGSPASGSLLKVESGLDRHVAYRARYVHVGAAGAVSEGATSVCSLLPHINTWERWPELVVGVIAFGFADQPTAAPVCR